MNKRKKMKASFKEIVKNSFSVVNDHKIKNFFFNFLKFHIIFIGFLGKSKDLYAIFFYSIILALYFLELLGSWGSFIFYYILMVGFSLLFSLNFPPLRKKMLELFGAKFVFKYLGNKRFTWRD